MKRQNLPLLLEQLEDRIFLDANPLVVADGGVDPTVDPVVDAPVESAVEAVATEPENTEQQTESDVVEEVETSGVDDTDSDNVSTQEDVVAAQDDETEVTQQEAQDEQATEENEELDDQSNATDQQVIADDESEDTVELIDPMVGENFTFSVSFDVPTTGDTVYGPYIDLTFDRGLEGTEITDNVTDDGLSFVDATYLGESLQYDSQIVNGDGEVTHNWVVDPATGTSLVITGLTPGDEFVTLLMPFGSFTPDQTAADILITAHMSENADVDGTAATALDVDIVTGAMFGLTPLDDPSLPDPPLRAGDGNPDSANLPTADTLHFLPEVIAFNTNIEVTTVASDCQTQHDPPDDVRNIESNHQEIPTGPNFPGVYVTTIDIADQQEIGGVKSVETLPDGTEIEYVGIVYTQDIPDDIHYTGIISVENSAGGALAYTLLEEPDYNLATPGGLKLQLTDTVTGGTETDDIIVRYGFYVPDILDPDTGNDPVTGDEVGHVINDGNIAYTWTPNDSAHDVSVEAVIDAEVDADGNFSDNPSVDDVSHAQSLAIQKDHVLTDTGATGYTPGDVLDYTLDFQISDYFSFGDNPADNPYSFRIDDTVANGLLFNDNNHLPNDATVEIELWEQGVSLGTVDLTAAVAANVEGSMVWTTDETDGSVMVHYNLEEILTTGLGSDGILDGGYATGGQLGATVGKITYQATIQDSYAPGHGLPGEDNIDQGDVLSGGVNIYGDIYSQDADGLGNPGFTGSSQSDESCDSLSITTGKVYKDIYAINGVTDSGLWDIDGDGLVHLSPGDTVSYHLSYDMPISSTEDFRLVDYLPLPIFDANDPDQDGVAGGWIQTADGVDNLDAGEWYFTSDHTYGGTFDDSYVDVANNALGLQWDEYHAAGDDFGKVDVVFSVQISDEPFGDGLFLTNQVTATEQGTLLDDSSDDAIIQIIVDEPELNIIKGVVKTDYTVGDEYVPVFSDNDDIDESFTKPGSGGSRLDVGVVISSEWLATNDIDTDLSNIDAGDTVTFAIVIENTGHNSAFDVAITDDLPPGFEIPGAAAGGLNLTVTTGSGTVLVENTDYTVGAGGFFVDGIELIDTINVGSIASASTPDPVDDDTGNNVIVITYDLLSSTSVAAHQEITNTATLESYASTDGGVADGNNYVPEGLTDTAIVTIADPSVEKLLVSTEINDSDNNNLLQAVIGEQATYQVTITIPEGSTPIASLVDTLDSGLTFVGLVSVVGSSGDLETSNGDHAINSTNITASTSGQDVTFDLGTITNSNTVNATPETITLTYTVFVNNTANANNQSGTTLGNSATVTFTGGTSNTVQADEIIVIEPDLDVSKNVDVGGSGTGSGDAGDSVKYTIVLEHNDNSETDAFDVTFQDQIPAEINITGWTAVDEFDVDVSDDFKLTGNMLETDGNFDMPESRVITIEVIGTLVASVTPSQSIPNYANVQWQSLDNDVPHNQDSTTGDNERIGDGAGLNDYADSGSATITITSVTVEKSLVNTEIHDDLVNPDQIDEVGVNERLEVIIGEEATYEVVITVPEGTMDTATLVDTLDAGLAIQQIDIVNASGDLVTDLAGGWTIGGTGVTYTTSGTGATGDPQTVTFNLGNMTNAINLGGAEETLTIRYTVLTLNDVGNSDGDTLTNSAQFNFADGNSDPDSAEEITVIEPQISTVKTINGELDGDEATVEVGDILTYTVVLTNTGHASAYEVTAVDTLAPGTRYYTDGTHTPGADVAGGITITDNGATIDITNGTDGWDIAEGDSVTITYYALVGADYFDQTYGTTPANLINTVDADWSSNDDTTSLTASDLDRVYDDGATGPTYTVDGTQDDDPAAFNIAYNGQLGDMVFFDSLGDGGAFNSAEGDVGIDGVWVTLEATVDGTTHTWTTQTGAGPGNVTGYYLFDNLPIFDDYTVTVDYSGILGGTDLEDDHGYLPTYDLDQGTHGLNNEVTGLEITAANPTLHNADVDFGYTGQNSVGDTVWFDVNDNGVQEGNEDGINGLTVTLTADIDGDGTYEYTATTTTQTINGVAGQYEFTHLPGGDYNIAVASPASSEQTWDYDDNLAASDDNADFSLAAVENNFDIDFGYRGTGSIGDFVWFDANADGLQDEAVPASGLGGVDLTLSGDFDGDGTGDYTVTTTTLDDGSYSFDHLLGGTYSITVDNSTLPSGASNWVQTFDRDEGLLPAVLDDKATDIALADGESRTDVDFGYTGTGTLGDTVWYDINANGVQDGTELGIEGVEVTITADVDGDLINEYTSTATTDANGFYTFINLPAAAYTTTINTATLPGGQEQTYDKDDDLTPFTTPDSDTTTLGIGADVDDVDFGYRGTGSIGDFLWYDVDGDGTQNEGVSSGMGGVDITISGDIDGDGVDDYSHTTQTADDGSYLFDNLFAGDYVITVDDTDLPDGMVQTFDYDDTVGPIFATAHAAAVTLAAGEDNDEVDFGYTGTGSIGDTVFFDADNSGGETAGDVGISGVDVTLTADFDGDGTAEYSETVRTDADGNYLFSNLAAFDDYEISVDTATSGGTNPTDLTAAGYSQTYDFDEGTIALDDTATSISLTAGQHREDIDFGYTGQNSVGDTVWFDVNADGVQDANEDGINGLEVTLTADIDGDGIFEYTAITTTQTIGGVDGQYAFTHLPGGDYNIAVTPPAGSEQTWDYDDHLAASDDNADFSLGADQDNFDIDFGYRGTGSIGDFVWFDANADGLQDEDILVSGLGGVELTLSGDFDGDGVDYIVTTTTADDGSYSFDHLLGGTYSITVDDSTLPSGSSNWVQTFDLDEGVAPAVLDDKATDIALADGQSRADVDFGYAGTGSLGDRVWYDLDADGVQDADELGMAGVEVQITADVDGDGTDEYVTSVVTDANGNYSFANLPTAEYTITINPLTLPGGVVATYDFDSATTAPDSTSKYLLAEGENTDRIDFGYTGSGSIGDRVWNDLNGDGFQDVGENGYSGVAVTLTGDLDGDGIADDTLTTVTDTNGNYAFDNLFLGDYTVTVDETTLPPGTNPTHDMDDPADDSINTGTPNSTAVTLTPAVPDNEDVDFGYNSQGTIGDTIWYDADGDGIQDADEAGLANITVTLDGPGGPVVVTTDANGNYLFDQLAAGDYTITLSGLPAGMNQTADPDGGNDNMASVSLADGETNLDQDFGYTGAGSIGDTIWNDADGDGTDNSGAENGIAGVVVTLTGDLDNDGVADDVLTTITDSNGHYSFDNLPEGGYTIVVDESTLPPGMNQTFDPEGAVDGIADVTLGGSEPMLIDTIDFGYQQTGTIGDTIWFDSNGDGVQDPGEAGLANVTVTLDGPGGTVVATTDENGNYLFDGLAAGDYTITVSSIPAGMQQTGDPDTTLDNASDLTLGEGEVNLDQDFAYTGTGSIGDTIWNDVDGDGTDNGGTEGGIAGVVVTLTGDLDNDGVADDVLTTTTDADGHYSFDQLPEGDYTIVVDETTLPPGMNQTFDPEGAVDGSADVILLAGDDIDIIDFGYQQTSTIGDTIWYDMDADGVQDPDELGLVNINITLTGDLDGDGFADDTLTTATDANGNYIFEDLPVGEYTITVDPTSLPGGMEQTYDFDGLGTPDTATVIIGANESNLDVDFGYTGTGTIGDTLWLDVDGDGLEDAGEPGLSGVSVTLTGDLDNDGQVDDTVTVVTDQNGHYSFPNLPAGDYIIEVDPATLPDGMNQTGDPDGTLDNATEVSLAAGETNILQDFGYTGTGSIGDTIWLDSNRNGVLDGGESGIAGVSVILTADFDGNGTVDFTTTTTTNGSGQYLFSNLPVGSYTISLDPATLPGGLEQTFDPDGLLNFQTTFSLGAGENNMAQDFGFAEPIVTPPVVPPVNPPVNPPVVDPPTPPVGPPVPADVALMYRFNHSAIDDDETFWLREPDETFMPPPIPVSPVYTGHAEPGTTVTLMLYDAMGDTMGYRTVMADSGGNWLASFSGSLLYDMPHSMAVGQTVSLYNESTPGLFNFRSYFNPTMTGLIFSSTKLDLQSISAYEASSISESMHNGHNALFNLGWNDSSGYEFLSPSINPAQHKR